MVRITRVASFPCWLRRDRAGPRLLILDQTGTLLELRAASPIRAKGGPQPERDDVARQSR